MYWKQMKEMGSMLEYYRIGQLSRKAGPTSKMFLCPRTTQQKQTWVLKWTLHREKQLMKKTY